MKLFPISARQPYQLVLLQNYWT